MFIILGHWHRLLHARALLAKRKRGKSEIHQVHDGPSFNSRVLSSRKDDLTDTDTVTSRETRNTTSPTSSRRSARRRTSRVSMTDLYEMNNSAVEWLKLVEHENLCRQVDDLADEDHTHHLTPQEHYNYKSNWWLRSNKIGSDTMPIRHRSDFKQALSTLQQLKEKEEEAQRNQRWAQSSSSSSWWSWQGSWWTPYSYESHHGDEPSTDWTGQLVFTSNWNNSSRHDFSWIHSLCYSWIVYSWQRSTVTDGEV